MGLLLTSGCSSQPYYGKISTANNYTQNTSIVDLAFNWGKHSAYSVPSAERDKHEMCVYFALDNLDLGQTCDWYANDNSASGVVKVVSHSPSGSGWCTTVFNTVNYKGKTKNWQETACVKSAGEKWYFIKG